VVVGELTLQLDTADVPCGFVACHYGHGDI
jgi:hypothetical protein